MIEVELSTDTEGEQDEIIVPHKTVKVQSTISDKIQNNTYEYDKYDIIDFLEPEYIDWLNSIPLKCWNEYKKDVEKSFCKISDERIMELVMGKIIINLPKYVADNFEKITLEVLKYCVKTNFEKLNTQIKKNDFKFNKWIKHSIEQRDFEFNKYFYEDLYFKLEQAHQYLGTNTNGNFFLLEGIWIHKANRFYKILKELPTSYDVKMSNYKLMKYFNGRFPNIFQNNSPGKKTYLLELYVRIFNESKINNWNDMIELKNILNISDDIFSRNLLIGNVYYYNTYTKYILPSICKLGNVELVFKTINTFWSDELNKIDNIINIMVFSSFSKNYELVSLLYNFYTFEKNIIFDATTCSRIAEKIIYMSDKKYHEYDKILYEWFNLGGVVKGYSSYTDYIESIKIRKK